MSDATPGGAAKWAVPVAIVLGLVLAAGILGLLLRSDDDPQPTQAAATPTPTATATPEPRGTINFEQGRAVPLDTPIRQVLRRLGAPARKPAGLPARQPDGRECIYYLLRDQPSVYQLCFDAKGLLASATTATPPGQ